MTPQEKQAEALIKIMESVLSLGHTEIENRLGWRGILMGFERDEALIVARTQWFQFSHVTSENADQLAYFVNGAWKFGIMNVLTEDRLTKHKLSRGLRKRRKEI
jgi:hypothetical protein